MADWLLVSVESNLELRLMQKLFKFAPSAVTSDLWSPHSFLCKLSLISDLRGCPSSMWARVCLDGHLCRFLVLKKGTHYWISCPFPHTNSNSSNDCRSLLPLTTCLVCLLQIIKASPTDHIHSSTCQSQSNAPVLCTDRGEGWGREGPRLHYEKRLFETGHVNLWLNTPISTIDTIKPHFHFKEMYNFLQCSAVSWAVCWFKRSGELLWPAS